MSRAETSQPKAAAPPVSSSSPPLAFFKPQRALFVLLLLVWVIWIGVLLWMYFKTLVPPPQSSPASRSAVALR